MATKKVKRKRKERLQSGEMEKILKVNKAHVGLYQAEAEKKGTTVKALMEQAISDKGDKLMLAELKKNIRTI